METIKLFFFQVLILSQKPWNENGSDPYNRSNWWKRSNKLSFLFLFLNLVIFCYVAEAKEEKKKKESKEKRKKRKKKWKKKVVVFQLCNRRHSTTRFLSSPFFFCMVISENNMSRNVFIFWIKKVLTFKLLSHFFEPWRKKWTGSAICLNWSCH